jgi:hypothetical protein
VRSRQQGTHGRHTAGRSAPANREIAERLVHKLDTFNDQHRAAQTRGRGLRRLTALLGISPLRGLIWDFYADLKAYQLKPGKRRARA